MDEPIIKAFVLCDEITDTEGSSGQMDLRGAGLSIIQAIGPFPIKRSFWVYVEIIARQPVAEVFLSLMRADSGRRFVFRSSSIQFPDPLRTTQVAYHVFDCIFPAQGIYFVELWYNGDWMIDQRLEVV